MKRHKKKYFKKKQSQHCNVGFSHILTNDLLIDSRIASQAFIYKEELDYISRCIHDYPDIETGGQLFGYLNEKGEAVVCYAIGPGPNANHQVTFFNQDENYLEKIYNCLHEKYALQYIGEWHSHHRLGLSKPSGHDASTIIHGITKQGIRHFLLCIGNIEGGYSTFNAFAFLNGCTGYNQVPWKIIGERGPYRERIDADLKQILVHPITTNALYRELNESAIVFEDNSIRQESYTDHWLKKHDNHRILKQITDYLALYNNGYQVVSDVVLMMDDEKNIHIYFTKNETRVEIVFDESFPYSSPRYYINNEEFPNPPKWDFKNDIFESFIEYNNLITY